MQKPDVPARDTIAPSDLTFGLSTCKRCLWLKYSFKFDLKKEFPLVKPLADSQEEHFRRASMQDIDPSLKPGVVKQWGQWVKSAPITINGFETRWKILGIYDLLGHYTDGTVGIIDCKVSDSDRDNGPFYAPQLEAYALALENPDRGKPFPVSSMGLLIWKLAGVTETAKSELASGSHGFGVNQVYVPVERDAARFNSILEELITTIEGGMPASGPDCNLCNYLIKRAELQID
ncbi:PD-(D/E)XK endonuclease-like domain, AddAB-type [Candidatus Nanopelagicaceae bacterium]